MIPKVNARVSWNTHGGKYILNDKCGTGTVTGISSLALYSEVQSSVHVKCDCGMPFTISAEKLEPIDSKDPNVLFKHRKQKDEE